MKKAIIIVLLVLLLAESLLFGMCIDELKAAYKDPDKAWAKYRPIMYRETRHTTTSHRCKAHQRLRADRRYQKKIHSAPKTHHGPNETAACLLGRLKGERNELV